MTLSFPRPRLLIAVLLLATVLRADDGMWLLTNPPLQDLKAKYGFEPTPAWLEHVQKASVRMNNGGSGSFASADGLVITNHHVASDAIYKLSSTGHNYLEDGYHAKSRAEELKCTDLELNVLMSIEDVTARVNAAVKPDLAPAEANVARRSIMAEIEKESLEQSGLRSDVVTLYQGGQYHLYRYKRYTDVRLVWAPEQQAAFFGGDPDNFEFPRYNLDVTLFRVYENDAPVKVEHYLKWNPAGTTAGELVFITGHPGSTQRLITMAELEYARDIQVPNVMRYLKNREVLLLSYSARSEENARRAKDEVFTIANSRKVYDGRISGLLDPVLIAAKEAEEAALKTFAADHPELGATDAWDKITAAQLVIARQALRHNLLEAYAFNSDLFGKARSLLRAATERALPNGERLREFRDSARTEFELALFSEEPVYEDFEILKIKNYLEYIAMELGAKDPVVQAALGGKAPAVRAAELVTGSKIHDLAFRKKLYAMSPEELAQVDDPMLALARAVDAEARAGRKVIEAQAEVKQQAHARIARVRYAKDGDKVSPDATFTLRLAYGTVKGLQQDGVDIPAYTDIAGTFVRATERNNVPPFNLPATWLAAKDRFKGDTPFNFIHTSYSIGGNSGSPTLNRNGEFVGILFDGNIHSLVWNYAYSDTVARSVSVDVRGILEAMRTVYGADELVAEILGTK
ncbi:Peptidase S46 [Lacunisphaera limnophila]|uniref:Dipeptidyl-peptidase n=1 Tax=Lacunisphaera limnophila TaxID=1838286 RepID=A0A1D8AUN9_9BACT|nr:S46 family peptidase [Lacunisphaera limnophila]AOS44610.1 Peptidase S46 [Lacunisphaera limnophila]